MFQKLLGSAHFFHWNYQHGMHFKCENYHVVPRSDMSGGPSSFTNSWLDVLQLEDDQSFSRRRMREQWWGAFPDGCFDCYENFEMMYGYFENFDGIPGPENMSLAYHPGQVGQVGQVLREEPPEAESKEDKAGDLVDALSQMLRTGSQQVPVDDEEEGELTMMGELKQMQSMGWFGWEFFDGMERSCSLGAVNSSGMSAPSYDDPQSPSVTNGSLVLLNVPLTTTEWDLRQIIEHVGVHAPITVKFEPGASSDINKVTLHFRNKIDLEIADVTLRETSWSTEDGGARIQIYRSENDGGTWAGYPAMPAMPPWDFGHSRSSWFSKEDGDSEPRSNSLANAVSIGNDDSSSPCPPEPSFEGTEFEKDWPKLPAARNKIADVQASQAASFA